MGSYIVRVFCHFGLLGAWNLVRGLGGSVFVNGGEMKGAVRWFM
ncbi:hypothetical protein [Bartonella sp. AP65SXKL]